MIIQNPLKFSSLFFLKIQINCRPAVEDGDRGRFDGGWRRHFKSSAVHSQAADQQVHSSSQCRGGHQEEIR